MFLLEDDDVKRGRKDGERRADVGGEQKGRRCHGDSENAWTCLDFWTTVSTRSTRKKQPAAVWSLFSSMDVGPHKPEMILAK